MLEDLLTQINFQNMTLISCVSTHKEFFFHALPNDCNRMMSDSFQERFGGTSNHTVSNGRN